MIYARLQVGEPTADKAVAPVVNSSEVAGVYSPPVRINGSLSVLDDSINRRAFDSVQLCLRGVISATIGDRSALEDVITLTDIKSASEFKPKAQEGQEDSQNGRHVDFYFELPTRTSTADGIFRPLPLSGIFKGTTNVAQDSALHDPRVVYGDCEVSYWIEAKFRRAGKQVGYLHRQVQIRSLYPRLRASFQKAKPLTVRAKPDILARCRFQKRPSLSVTLPDSEMPLKRDDSTGKRSMSLPLAVAMESVDACAVNSRQSLSCTLEAKWQVTTRFSIGGNRKGSMKQKTGETIHKVATASTQKSSMIFRPLPQYDQNESQLNRTKSAQPLVATAQLDLAVPEAISQPTLGSTILSRAYTLTLALHFNGTQGIPNYSVNASFPLSVVAYGSKADDAFHGHPGVDCLHTGSDAGDEENDDALLEQLGSLNVGREQLQARPPRVTRTPPPPYFR